MNEQMEAIVADVNREVASEPGTMTDLAPPGALELGKLTARFLSAADFRILRNLVLSTPANDPIDDMEAAQILVYMLTQYTAAQIRDLWRVARKPQTLREKVMEWAATVPANEFMALMDDVGPQWAEFQGLVDTEEPADDGADPLRPSRTGSASSSSS